MSGMIDFSTVHLPFCKCDGDREQTTKTARRLYREPSLSQLTCSWKQLTLDHAVFCGNWIAVLHLAAPVAAIFGHWNFSFRLMSNIVTALWFNGIFFCRQRTLRNRLTWVIYFHIFIWKRHIFRRFLTAVFFSFFHTQTQQHSSSHSQIIHATGLCTVSNQPITPSLTILKWSSFLSALSRHVDCDTRRNITPFSLLVPAERANLLAAMAVAAAAAPSSARRLALW